MINLYFSIGGITTTQLQFDITETRLDRIHSIISAKSINSQVADTWFANDTEQNHVRDDLAIDYSVGLTLSVYMQAGTATDVDFYNGLGAGLKHILVELIT